MHMSQTVIHTQDYSRGLMFESLFVRKLGLYKALLSRWTSFKFFISCIYSS